MKQDDSSVGPPPMQLSACPRHGVNPTLSPPSLQVGFLKILHKYEITFLLPLVQRLGKDVCAVPLPNINLRVISITSLPEGKVPTLSPFCPPFVPTAAAVPAPGSCPCFNAAVKG